MQTSMKKAGLSLDLLMAIRLNQSEDGDPWVGSQHQLRACEEIGAQVAQGVQKQLTACGMGKPVDWLRHRALVIGYACGMSESSRTARWVSALTCLCALSVLLGSEWGEDALCLEAQRLREQEHPGYVAGLDAASRDRSTMSEGKTPTALARLIIDREMRYR